MFWVRIGLQVWLLINYVIVWHIDFGIDFVFLAGVCCFFSYSAIFYPYISSSLRSQNSGLLVVPRIAKSTKGGRTFSYLA